MNGYKYELHTHTAEVSPCSKIDAVALVRHYKQKDYSGICITDHFSINRAETLFEGDSWDDKMSFFESGFLNAKQEGKKLDINVFFGFEFSDDAGTDFLIYNLDINWLRRHPEIMQMDINTFLDFVRAQGGFVVHAHPFREAHYIPMIKLLPRRVDGIEINNANMPDLVNDLANIYAESYGLLKIAASDTHNAKNNLNAVICQKKHPTIEGVIDDIKNRGTKLFMYNINP